IPACSAPALSSSFPFSLLALNHSARDTFFGGRVTPWAGLAALRCVRSRRRWSMPFCWRCRRAAAPVRSAGYAGLMWVRGFLPWTARRASAMCLPCRRRCALSHRCAASTMSWGLVCARRAWPRCSASTVAGPVLPVLLFTMRAILPRRAWRSGCMYSIFARCSAGPARRGRWSTTTPRQCRLHRALLALLALDHFAESPFAVAPRAREALVSGQTVGQCVAVYVHALRELTAIQPGAEHTGHQLHGAGHFVDAFEQGNFVAHGVSPFGELPWVVSRPRVVGVGVWFHSRVSSGWTVAFLPLCCACSGALMLAR